MKKTLYVILAAVLCITMIIPLVGCVNEDEDRPLVFGNITFDHAGSWSQLSVSAFTYAAETLGVEVIVIPVITNLEDQLHGMETLISAGVDAISIYTTPVAVELSQMASDAGIPVSFENGVPDEGAIFVSIATHDWRVLGERTAAMHLDLFRGRDVLLVLGAPGMGIVEPWLEGYMEVYNANGAPFNIVGTEYTDWGTELALNVTQDYIQSGRHFDAVFAHNGPMFAGVMVALQDAGMMDSVVKAAGGGQDEELQWIREGLLDGTISYLPAAQGIATFKALWLHMNGMTPPRHYDLPMVPITLANVNDAVPWDDIVGAFSLIWPEFPELPPA